MKVLAVFFLLASLFVSKDTFATGLCLSGVTAASSGTVCSGDSTTLTVTGLNTAGSTTTGPWSANYQWDSSSDGGVTFVPIAGASGSISAGSPTATYNTGALFVNTTYRVRLTSVVGSCIGSTAITSNNVTLTITPSPAGITGNTNICLGSTSCLTDVTTGGTWSSTNTGVATVGTNGCVFGAGAGTTNIVYTVAGGCTAVTALTVNATAVISGPTNVCVGNTILLTDATAGVTWSSGNTSVATVDPTTGVVTGVTGGTASIIATSPLGCVALTTITVNPNPVAITGNTSICINSTNCLTDATNGGTWSSSNTAVGTISSTGCVTATTLGSSMITYTLITGCYTTTLVSVNALPTSILGTPSVCVGLTTSLSDATPGVTFTSGNTAVATVSSITGIVTGVTAGTATIIGTSAAGCTTSVVVTVNPLAPITGILNACLGFTTALSDAATGGVWSASNSNAAINSSTGVVTANVIGLDTITYTLPFGCTATAVVTVNPLPSAINGNATICVGSTTTLTDPDAGGSWSSGAPTTAIVGSSTGTVTGINGGTATITYTLPTGCYTTYVVSVNPVSTITGNMSVCVGNITALTDATGGGTWSSSNPTVGTVDASGNVTGLSAGTTLISYALGSGCSASTVVTVNPLPSNITGNLNICAWGGSTNLTDASTGGIWSSSGVVVDPFLGVVTGYAPGTGSVTYSLPTGCMTVVTVTVNLLPDPITGNTTVCVGSTTTLSDLSGGGTWSSTITGVAIVGSGTGIVTGEGSGTTEIIYTLPTGCAADTSVLVNPLPVSITGPGAVCYNSTISLNDATTGGTWSSSNGAIASISTAGVVTGTAIAGGTATITYTIPTGCYITTVITVNPLPLAITGTMSTCMGTVSALTDATAGGTWSSSNTAIDTVNVSGNVYGVTAGNNMITYTLPTGCYVTTTFTVNPIYAISGNAVVCFGSTTTLTDTATGGSWSSADIDIADVGTSTGVVTGTDPSGGTTTITYTLATGCSATIIVTVNPLPSNITGTLNVCVGQTTALSDATPAGNWTTSNSSVASVGATGIVTGVSAGTATISYALSTGCYVTAIVTVNPLSAITGNLNVCQGFTTALTDATTGGTWSSSNPTSGTVDNSGNVSGLVAGTTTISYLLPTGCLATAIVTVNPLGPIMGGNTGICTGFTITLSDAAAGGIWTATNTTATVNPISGSVTGNTAGVDTIIYTLPSGCTATTTVTINTLAAITGPTNNVCQGSTINLTDATAGGTWSASNGDATVSATGVVTGVSSGTDIISYSYSSNCWQIYPVVVNPITPITGATSICPGLTITLSDATAGGTWSSSDTTIATVNSSGVVTGVSASTATITYTASSGCTATTVVTVNIVYPITGNTSLCMGTTSALTDITAGGTWTSGNTAIATVGSTGLVTANSTTVGTASITYTLPSGCIAIAVVTVNAYPAAITGPNQVCIGATIILSDATAGGAWSSTGNPITTTGSITGLFPGVDTITYQLPTGCSAKYLVTVNPLPALIHGSMVVCQGLTTTLSDIPGGGTWTSSVTSIATVNGSTGVVTGVAPGTTTITYTLPTGCYVDTLFTVNQLPLPISGTASVCLGLTTTLTDGTPGGTWSSSNGHATIGSSTGIVFGASVGTSVITYTLPTGCLNTIIVTVNPLPGTILGSSSVCDGQTITLSDAGGGTWSSSNTAIATVSSAGVVTGVVAGTVNITYTLGTGCIITKTITVNVLSPINGTTSLCIGLTTSLSDTSGGGGGTWSINNPAVGTISTSGVVTGIGQGTATVSYVLSSGCTATILVSVYPLPSVVNGTLTVCAGQTTTLSDNVTGGTWTSGNTSIATIGSSSGIVTGVAAGTTNITYTLGTGCVVNAVVTVYPFGPIVGPTNICQGLTYAYSDAAPGGLWSSSNPGVVSINATTGVATGGGTTGTATLTYTIFPTGCTATLTVTVNALGPINGNSDLCVGVSTIFSDAVTGGTWSSSNPVVASVGPVTGIVTGHNNGVAIISYVLPSGCTATLTVTVNTLAPITGPSTVCQTDSIALTDATPGGVWSTSDATTASVSSSGEVDGNNSGTAIISYSYGPGCVVIKPVSVYPSTPIFGNLNVCIGLTSTLSDTTAGGTWSSSNSGIASITPVGVVFGVHVGTATITYTLGTGCIRTAVVTVNITAAIQGMDSVCVGLTTTLTDATAGVTWSSSNTGVASVGSSTGVVLGNSQGTTTITATSPVGCLATVIVTVNPLPTAILGNAAVCVGLTTTLTDATTPGTWSSSNTGIATVGVTTGIVTGVTAGTATITYTLPTTCIITRVVTVNPLPVAITGQLAVCVNSASILTDASSGGTWSASNGHATIGSASGVLLGVSANGVNPSFDTITYTLGTGCIITAVATINPLPGNILGNFNICLGSTNALSDTTAGGTWASSNTAVGSVDPVGNVSGLTLGTTYITYTIPTGCLEVQEVTVDPLPQPINGIDSVCVGSFITLTDGTFGGTWTSSNTGVATVGSGTGVVTGVSAVINGGIDTITYTLGTGCTVTATITVDPLPTVINGNFNVCIGTCNTLSDATALGTWSSSDTAIAPVSASGVVCGHNLGVATITYTLPTGCVVTQQVTVDPLPLPITGSVPVCVGSTITLNDATLPPGSGTWTSSLVDTATVGLTTGVVTGVSSGTTTITYQLSATGCISTVIVTVDPLPNIITGNNEVCVLDSIQLTDSSHGGIWISGNTGLATVGSTGKVYGVDSGTVLISYQLPTGCYRTFSVTVNPLPGAIMGDSVVCVGSNILLSDASVGGTWTSSLTTIATINSVTGNLYGVDSGTTVVTYTSNLSCIAHRVVTVNPVPTPILGASALCNGFTTILSDTSSGGEWSASNPAITTVSPAGVVIFATNVTAHAPGTDTIFYTYPVTGCYAFKIFTVHPIPVITVTESPTGQICIGGSVQLSASGAGSGGTYAWTPPTALSLTTGTPVTASPTVTTTYTVVGTTQYGCKHDTTATVFVDSVLLHIHITGKDSICRGDRDTLIASGFTGSLFAWTPVTDLNCTICDTTVMTGGTAGVFPYVATAIDSFGCKFSATFTVTVNALPNITVSPNPAIVCRGSSTTLHASGAATYTWFPNAFLSCDNCANPIASDTQNLVYNVIGTSQYGCRDSILVPVSVLDTTMNTISKDTILCLGNSAQLIATSTSVDGSRPDYYLWIPGTGLNDSTIPNPVATPDTTTLYTLIIKENACFNDTEHVTVFVEPYPAITITTNPSVSGPIIAGTAVQLSASIGNEVLLTDYEWTPGTGLSCQHCYNTIASPSLTTTYTFTATSNYGCTSHADVTISLMCDNSQVFIPNTFTPNGDGHNDRFYVSGKGIGSVLRLSVYNRWGELMFETHNTNANDPAAGWDGTYKGVVLEPDVFVYIVQVTCELGGQPYNFKGDISLVR